MIGKLTGSAASGLSSIGSSALNTGLSANAQQAQQSQEQMQNWQNSILGKGLSTGASFAETGGLGALAGGMDPSIGSSAGAQGAWGSWFNGGF